MRRLPLVLVLSVVPVTACSPIAGGRLVETQYGWRIDNLSVASIDAAVADVPAAAAEMRTSHRVGRHAWYVAAAALIVEAAAITTAAIASSGDHWAVFGVGIGVGAVAGIGGGLWAVHDRDEARAHERRAIEVYNAAQPPP